MPLTNAQYDSLEREYGRIRARQLDERDHRIQKAYARIPALKELEEEIADASYARAQAALLGDRESRDEHASEVSVLQHRRARLLKEAGLPADYLELHYDCPDCRDTGYINGEPCHCRKRAVINLLYDQSAIRDILEKENFTTYQSEYFRKIPQKGERLAPADVMAQIQEAAWDFIDEFGDPPANLLLTGQAGSGKTFLSNCIARELLDRFHPVLYLSAPALFEALAEEAFGRGAGGTDTGLMTTCDLLIIDDLGTELTNQFVITRLFYLLNERILRGKSTIISTNLSMNDISRIYSDRVASRIVGHYRILQFPNQDIRLQKNLRKETVSHE